MKRKVGMKRREGDKKCKKSHERETVLDTTTRRENQSDNIISNDVLKISLKNRPTVYTLV